MVVLSTHGGHGVTDQGLVDGRRCLNVGCDDERVLPQLQLERVAGPVPLDLRDVEGDSSEEILEGRADPNAVPLQGLEPGCALGCSNPLQEFCFGEGSVCVLDLVGEKMRGF